jgi:serine protease Do
MHSSSSITGFFIPHGRLAAQAGQVSVRARRLVASVGLAALLGLNWSGSPARAQALPEFPELVEKVGPSVVNIRTTEKVRPSRGMGGEMNEDMMELFRQFGFPIPGMPRQGPRRGAPQPENETPETRPSGTGSGFILSADGYVMTNAHVIKGADEVTVTLTDKREFKARVVGADEKTDVAVVKIEATGLPAVRIGDVNKLRVGEWVIAIGSPFGFDSTVTAGIVSAKGRDTGEYLPFIQTDVAINPGNSGGPLINMRGEVVGINSQIYSRSGGFMGISFSIPIDEASRVADQLRANGRVARGRIGISITGVSKDVAESLGLSRAQGAVVSGVEPGSPADKAGLEPGDIITKVDGKVLEKSTDLPRLIGGVKPGAKVNLQLLRRNQYRDVAVVVADLDGEKTARKPGERESAKPGVGASAMGLSVAELTAAQRRDLKVRGGVRVEAADGPAARSGIREGDVITEVNQVEVSSVAQFESLLAKADASRPVVMLVRRGEMASLVVIRPGGR